MSVVAFCISAKRTSRTYIMVIRDIVVIIYVVALLLTSVCACRMPMLSWFRSRQCASNGVLSLHNFAKCRYRLYWVGSNINKDFKKPIHLGHDNNCASFISWTKIVHKSSLHPPIYFVIFIGVSPQISIYVKCDLSQWVFFCCCSLL